MDSSPGKKNHTRLAPRLWQKADFVLLAAIVAAALLLALGGSMRRQGTQEPQLEIMVGNRLYGIYTLTEERQIAIGEGNVCEIRDGQVRMIEADCPDQLCVRSKAITQGGGSIVCLPNHVVLRIVHEDTTLKEVDTIAE